MHSADLEGSTETVKVCDIDIMNFDYRVFQNLFEFVYLLMSGLISLILSAIIVDKLQNNQKQSYPN